MSQLQMTTVWSAFASDSKSCCLERCSLHHAVSGLGIGVETKSSCSTCLGHVHNFQQKECILACLTTLNSRSGKNIDDSDMLTYAAAHLADYLNFHYNTYIYIYIYRYNLGTVMIHEASTNVTGGTLDTTSTKRLPDCARM